MYLQGQLLDRSRGDVMFCGEENVILFGSGNADNAKDQWGFGEGRQVVRSEYEQAVENERTCSQAAG